MKPGFRSTELWLTVGIIFMIILFASILAATGKLTGSQWINMVGTVSTLLGGLYSLNRTGAKIVDAFRNNK